MKLNHLLPLLAIVFFACKTEPEKGPWADFKKCTGNCVKEALAVKDAFLKSPKETLGQFQETYAKGEDHVIGWIQVIRDSVLVNSAMGSIEERFKMQQAILETAKPFENDPKLGEMAKSVTGAIEMLAIASEMEDDIQQPNMPATGSYAYQLANEAGSGELLVTQVSSEKLKFKLSVTGSKPAYNQGMIEGIASLIATNIFEYSTKEFGGECTLQFIFADGVQIKTLKGNDATCGFGHNVTADGEYARKSFTDPFLSKADAKMAAGLIGNWQSTSDTKSIIKIADGYFQEMYDGKEAVTSTYIYFPKCPSDCNPVAKTPCIKVIAQDEVCYTVVKADGKTLELSQVGGTGNTNKYVKL